MEQITPLARILAEANGIDWQQLRGSGSGSTVVEQDILNYLSRVMSGEEEPPAPPVDEMPGGWADDGQPPAGMFSAGMLSQAGIDSGIADLVMPPRAPEAPAASAAHGSMEFGPGDDLADLNAPPVAEPQPSATDWSFAPPQTHAAQIPEIQAPEIQDAPQPSPSHPPSHSDIAADGGLSGLLARLYRKDRRDEATPIPETMPQVQPAPIAGWTSGSAAELSAPEFEVQTPTDIPLAEVSAAEPQVDQKVYAAEVTAPEVQIPEMEAPELGPPELGPPELGGPEVKGHIAPAVMAGQEAAPQPVAQPQLRQPAVQPVTTAARADRPASAVWFGTYLRRDAGVGAADELRAQLSKALGKDISLAFLVARAAQRHADALGPDLGRVALQGADGHNQPITGGALRDAVNALRGGQDSAPDLLVTDAGALGMDDLHYPHTLTLSLGRVQDGRAALSLNGDVDPRQAAQFLTRVAEALERPIALVL
ncbi:E3 binding domain-containing protein [Deinococcus frigens]|uniref:E3 binding domain-containing protein n=1 Tax=Deinococcus frigens TaxID=249403 RepID=UPI0004959FD9|nr:E3 binding domain-containing protein [Deinococcus frigens]